MIACVLPDSTGNQNLAIPEFQGAPKSVLYLIVALAHRVFETHGVAYLPYKNADKKSNGSVRGNDLPRSMSYQSGLSAWGSFLRSELAMQPPLSRSFRHMDVTHFPIMVWPVFLTCTSRNYETSSGVSTWAFYQSNFLPIGSGISQARSRPSPDKDYCPQALYPTFDKFSIA